MAVEKSHTERVREELRNAGVSAWGLLKFAINHLPKIIGRDEHINGVVYGRYTFGNEKAKTEWEEGTMVATDKRVIFLDKKPGYIFKEDIGYDAITDIDVSRAPIFSAVTLFSKVGNFSLRYARNRYVDKFVEYVERRRLQPA